MQKEDNIRNEALAEDSGYGKKFTGSSRLIKEDGSFNLDREGSVRSTIYEYLVNTTWVNFFSLTFVYMTVFNSFFAVLLNINGIQNINGEDRGWLQNILDCLYFSIQTFTSVGYGAMHPKDNFSGMLSSFIALVGLLSFALATGLLFSRFSKAKVNINFSKNLIIAPYQEGTSLQFRIVNTNNNILMNMEASLTITWLEDIEGITRRKFHRLPLELDFIYLFPLNWTLVHKIDDKSPLYDKDKTTLISQHSELLVMIRGFDDTYGQFIYKNHSYHFSQMVENVNFVTMYENKDDKTILYLNKLDELKPPLVNNP